MFQGKIEDKEVGHSVAVIQVRDLFDLLLCGPWFQQAHDDIPGRPEQAAPALQRSPPCWKLKPAPISRRQVDFPRRHAVTTIEVAVQAESDFSSEAVLLPFSAAGRLDGVVNEEHDAAVRPRDRPDSG